MKLVQKPPTDPSWQKSQYHAYIKLLKPLAVGKEPKPEPGWGWKILAAVIIAGGMVGAVLFVLATLLAGRV